MPLTPADVRNKQFSTTRLRPGYDEEEVDAFLDEVEAELDRLLQENEDLRSKLAEFMRGGKARRWAPWCSSVRSSNGEWMTCAPSSVSIAAGSRPTWKACCATSRPGHPTPEGSAPWAAARSRYRPPCSAPTCATASQPQA